MSTFEKAKLRADELSMPAVHIVRAGHGRFSRLGGKPTVPAGFSWPAWNDEPLAFLAQLDLSEMAAATAAPWMPVKGQLYFFYDKDQTTWGFDPKDRGSWRVIYCNEAPATLFEAEVPAKIEQQIYSSLPVEFRNVVSRPDWQRLDVDTGELSESDFEKLNESRFAPFGNGAKHQLFGYPIPVQGDHMELECQLASNGVYCGTSEGYQSSRATELSSGAMDWRLLLQLDSDDDAGMMWGDVGTLYFWIREEDARRDDFSNVWMILQCG